MRTGYSKEQRLFNVEFGFRVALAREVRGLRQDQLASIVGLSRTSIVNIEAGKQGTTFCQALLFAKALKVSLKRLTPSMLRVQEAK